MKRTGKQRTADGKTVRETQSSQKEKWWRK